MRRGLLSVGLWLFVGVARAQAPVALPPVDVPFTDEPAAATSATRREPTGAVSIVEARSAQGQARTVADLVTAVPGATVQDVGGLGQRKTVSLRGAASNAVLVLLDGVPLVGSGLAADLSRIPLAFVERLEVLRGGGSRWGPGALGGVVDIVTRAPDGVRASAELTQGSFLTTTGVLGGSAKLGPGEALVLLHGLSTAGDFLVQSRPTPELTSSDSLLVRRANNDARQGGALGRYRQRLGAATLDVLAQGFADDRGLAGPLLNPTTDGRQQALGGVASARLAVPLEGGGDVSVLLHARGEDSTLRGTSFGPVPYRQQETAAGLEAQLTRLVAQRHGLTALLSVAGTTLSAPGDVHPTEGRVGAMLGDDLLIFDGAWVVSASARLDVVGPALLFSPRLGTSVQLPYGFEVRANAGQASRAPSFAERYLVQGMLLPNPTLRPERGLTADLGLAWVHSRASVSVAAFGALYEDLISYEYYPPTLARPYNFAAAGVKGLEVEAKLQPVRGLEAQGAYTFLSTQNLKDDPRYYLQPLPYRPAHRLHARLVAGGPHLSAHGQVAWQSEQYQNRTATLALPARTFVDVGVSATPLSAPALTFSLELKNLLDAQSQDVDGYPLPPRAAYLTLAVSWDAAHPRK